MKRIVEVMRPHGEHWVGDGFPVRSLFHYGANAAALSPFLLLDYAGPFVFEPAERSRGVGEHPHRGFETVTIVYDGEVAHRDSAGNAGTVGPGDVQWMTAGAGILHEERHAPGFTKTGGPFRMVQLWVNLPAADKATAPRYQTLRAADIPSVALPAGAGTVRVVAGSLDGIAGPARTATPLNLWDARLTRDADATLALPAGHTAMLAVLTGHVTVNGAQPVGAAEVLRFAREGTAVGVHADGDATFLVLTGAPLDEPVAGRGPFVMTSEADLRRAFDDFESGRFGRVA